MAKPLLLVLILTWTAAAFVAAASAASVTIYNPTTLPVDVVLLSAAGEPPGRGSVATGEPPRGGVAYDYEEPDPDDFVVKVSTAIMTVNLTGPEQDIQIKSTTGEEQGVEVHVHDGDVLVILPAGDGGLGFKVLLDSANITVPPPPKY